GDATLWVGNAVAPGPADTGWPRLERGVEFGKPGGSIVRDRRVAVQSRVPPVARRAVGHLDEQRIAKAAQLRSHADRFVIGVRDHDHDSWLDHAAVAQGFEDSDR